MSLAEKIKVLIVDDQVTSRLLLSDALTQLGFKQITAAGDGEQGMKIMEQQPHHLVISDFNMPKMDGLGFLHAVRANPTTKKAAFIILTAQGDRALVQLPSSAPTTYWPSPSPSTRCALPSKRFSDR